MKLQVDVHYINARFAMIVLKLTSVRGTCCGKSWDNQQERVWRLNHCRDFKGEAMGIGCNGKSMEEEMRLLLGPS